MPPTTGKTLIPINDVVQMRDHKIGAGELPVDRHRSGHDSGDAADHEQQNEAREEQERRS